MSYNPVGNILCQRCENFVDGHDCIKCGWEQPLYEEDPLTKAEARIKELEEMLRWYIEEDEINEGDPDNQYWIDGKHKAMKLLGMEIEE